MIGLLNVILFDPQLQKQGKIVAYRGGGSLVNYDKVKQTNCTALSLEQSGLDTVENTLQAVSVSVKAGAHIIHLNVNNLSSG